MTTATHATVTINSIHVIDSSVNTTSEPGSAAEWYMTFFVNGQTAQWSHDGVKDDTVYAVNRSFPNIPLSENGMITIQVSGYEHDTLSANDTLPTLQKTIHPAQDFELGGTDWAFSPVSPEGSYKIEFTVIPAQGQALAVAREYVGLYRSGKGGYALWSGDWKSFTEKGQELSAAGLRLQRIATFPGDTGVLTFGDSSTRYFAGVFGSGTDGHALWVSDWPSFEKKWKELSAQGLRLVDLACYLEGNTRMFAGVFRAGTDGYALYVSDWSSFDKKCKELVKSGLRLIALDTYKDGSTRIFAGVFRAGNDDQILSVGLDWKGLTSKRAELAKAGLRLIDIASYAEGGKQVFAAVFRAGTDLSAIKRGSWDEFVQDWQKLSNGGGLGGPLRLVSMDTFVYGQEE